jgi:hypothetical protein
VYATIVNALSFTATMTPSSTTVPESAEFTVAVKVSNLDVGSNGINSLSGYLSYDTKVFETISESSIEGMNSWSPSYNADNNGKITLTKNTWVKTEENVFQVTFKTLEGPAGKTGNITFTGIVASNSASEITASDISITINVGEAGSNTANIANVATNGAILTINTNTSTSNSTTNSNAAIANTNVTSNSTANTANSTSNINNNVISSYVNSVNTSTESDIPYTGVEDTIMYLIGAAVVIAIVFYIKFEKINKDMK